MKKHYLVPLGCLLAASIATPVVAAGNTAIEKNSGMLPALILLGAVSFLAVAICVFLTATLIKANRTKHGKMNKTFHYLMVGSYVVAAIAIIFTIFCANRYQNADPTMQNTLPSSTTGTEGTDSTTNTQPTQTIPPETSEPTVPTIPENKLEISYSPDSDPSNWGVNWEILVGNTLVDSYDRTDGTIYFSDPTREDYFALPGIATFRGDNYRSGASYGTVNITEEKLTNVWNQRISSMLKPSGTSSWTGSGWTGQPVVVEWDAETRQIMNLYDSKKAKDGLVEVIYATLDGHIYFYDLEDGSYTRDPLEVGMAFKGAGALDPRGYPIFYVGSGDLTYGGQVPRMYIISLIDCSIMYENGNNEPMKHRNWTAFDSAPLVDAETDTLIWPGENGLLYTIKLNTNYNKAAGTLSINPDAPVKTRYTTSLGRTLGYENSCVVVGGYLYIADNGCMLHCVDLNTMELMWSQDIKDDTNATMVFEWEEDGNGYLYTASSVEYNEGTNGNGTVYLYKINAANGEIVWEKVITNVGTNSSVSGGVLSTPVLGKKGTTLEGLVIHSISRTPTFGSGTLLALDTATGEIVWETTTNHYAWSSPVAVYTEDGIGYVIICDSNGTVHLLNGTTGATLSITSVGSNVEASPIVFKDMMVVGTRGQQVYGIKIS